MRKSYVIALISIVFSLCTVHGVLAQAKTQYEIGSVLVEGNVGISRAEVLSKVRSRVGSCLTLLWLLKMPSE